MNLCMMALMYMHPIEFVVRKRYGFRVLSRNGLYFATQFFTLKRRANNILWSTYRCFSLIQKGGGPLLQRTHSVSHKT